ncbi:MAG TPA: hypothetical protein VG722_05065 [Tepidisphaeraceae bacterium]|nr:hypothetical protein [Tepidisphaeraceae bacterium]
MSFLFLAAQASPSSQPVSPIKILRIDLIDGHRWTLGPGAVGRPFDIRVVLVNTSDQSVQLWPIDSSEGAECAKVILASAEGGKLTLSSAGIRRSGRPVAKTLQPHETYAFDLDLLRLIDDRNLSPGQYQLQVTYSNDQDSSGRINGVWTGSVASQLYAFEIVLPKHD